MNSDISKMTIDEMTLLICKDQSLKLSISENMIRFGGSFVKVLGELIMRADRQNLVKIIDTWSDYIIKYRPEVWK